MIGGDFNVDLMDQNVVISRYVNSFLQKESLKCAIESGGHAVDFTFESKANGSRSVLDHFLVSSNICECIDNYYVKHDGDNVSDHSPVCMSLNINYSRVTESVDCENVPRYQWHQATDTELVKYKSTLDEYLSNICIPWEVIQCRDIFVLVIMN